MHHLSALDLVTTLQDSLVGRNDLDAGRVGTSCSALPHRSASRARTWPEPPRTCSRAGAHVPGVTINRFCASGIDAVARPRPESAPATSGLAVAGGVESVSRVPIFSDDGALWRDPEVVRAVGSVHMGIAADLNATAEGWTREQLDSYAVETHTKAARAGRTGCSTVCVVPLPGADRVASFATDELIRPGTTMAAIADLPPAFAELRRCRLGCAGSEGAGSGPIGPPPHGGDITGNGRCRRAAVAGR